MKKLEIQLLLQLHGLQHVVDYLKLDYRELGNLVLLKYRQLDADWTKKALLDCRGLILDRSNDWKIVAFPYEKFFNLGEGYCASIDWDTAQFYKKEDGSLVNMYFYNDEWHVQTSGGIDGSGNTNNPNLIFRELFWYTVKKVYSDVEAFKARLNTSYNYMFELCTPDNIVVVPHSTYQLILHGVRDMTTLNYVDIDSTGLICVERYDINHVDDMMKSIEGMTWMEEGLIVCDANYNRAKCKNPKYVAVHHVSTGVSPYAIVNVIKTNERDEFLAYFKHKAPEVDFLQEKWDALKAVLEANYSAVKHIEDEKEFASMVFKTVDKRYTGMMFALKKGHIHSIHEGMSRLRNDYWYKLFDYQGVK